LKFPVSPTYKARFLERKGYLYIYFATICLIIHGIFIFYHGFFWDDWSQLFLRIKFGDSAYWEYFLADRPTSGWTAYFFNRLFLNSPILWDVFILFLKYFSGFLSFKLLECLWPENRWQNFIIISLFLVCPLFSQSYISVAYTQHYLNYILFLLSVICLVAFLKHNQPSKKILFGFLSIFFMILQLSITEYFSFLEWIKFPVIFIIYKSKNLPIKTVIKKTLTLFTPIFLIFVLYSIFRLNFAKIFPILEADQPVLLQKFASEPFQALISLIKNIILDFSYIFFNFIGKVISIDLNHFFRSFHVLVAILLIVLFFIMYSFLSNLLKNESENPDTKSEIEMLIFAILWIILSILPFWTIGESYVNAEDPPHADRHFFASVFGAVILFSWIIRFFIQSGKKYVVAVCILSSLFASQFFEENDMAKWQTEKQSDVYWQMFYRMPSLSNNTAIVDDTVIFPFQGNFSTSSALNILYSNPINENGTVPIWVFDAGKIRYEQHAGFHTTKRNFQFIAPTQQMIFIDYDNQFANCIWIFSPEDIDHPHVSETQKTWIAHSDISRIGFDNQSVPSKNIFGSPKQNWCSLYQKASLYRQFGKWDQLNKLTQIALENGFSPSAVSSNSPFEWWPFVEGLIRNGSLQIAEDLSIEAIQTDPAYKDFYCTRWNQLLEDSAIMYNTNEICGN
jgi:heme A synthase